MPKEYSNKVLASAYQLDSLDSELAGGTPTDRPAIKATIIIIIIPIILFFFRHPTWAAAKGFDNYMPSYNATLQYANALAQK